MKEFSGLDRQPFDQRPLEMRKQILQEGLSQANLMDESLVRNEDGELDKDALEVEAYTLASVVIENMWQNLREHPDTFSTPESERLPITEDFWKEFADHYIEITQAEKDRTFASSQEAFFNEDIEPTQADMAAARYMYVKMLDIEQLGLPSFIDFISIYTRLARAIEETSVIQTGVLPTREEYELALANTSLHNMMAEMMLNSRDATFYLITALEGTGKNGNTDDTSRSFDPRWFEFAGNAEDGSLSLVPKPEVFAKVKPLIAEATEQHRQKNSPAAVKRCPVIYTGLFKEMCQWMNHEFTHQYLDQRYPMQMTE
ncbi:hypothetical protein N9L26_02555 [Candidatus Pacebacteria bacterium]|nr:hypothetical protein [Candidatus Paceibacterota bacterium]